MGVNILIININNIYIYYIWYYIYIILQVAACENSSAAFDHKGDVY